jgi:hypothetical protein
MSARAAVPGPVLKLYFKLRQHFLGPHMNKSLVLASLVAAVALAACGKKEEAPAPVAAPVAAPAAAAVADAAASAASAVADTASAAMGAANAVAAAASAAASAAK